jgi:23S rRNA (guanine745-N1)-methyltransferase
VYTSHFSLLLCPICHTQFAQSDKILTCTNNHTFDLSKEGYVNFVQKKVLGDTKEMLLARRNFFAKGHYAPLSEALNTTLYTHLKDRSGPLTLFDAGCGEGYYLHQLQLSLAERQLQTLGIGLDSSKEAVRLAARQSKEAFFVVGNLKEHLPFVDDAFAVLLNIFAPRNLTEFARVLLPDGLLFVIIPAPTHLQTLRTVLPLLQIEENKQQHVIAQFTEQGYFRLETSANISYELALYQEEISQLVTMTPNYWHLTTETRRAIEDLKEIRTEVACVCLLFRRCGKK